jgi:hypothetical protein
MEFSAQGRVVAQAADAGHLERHRRPPDLHDISLVQRSLLLPVNDDRSSVAAAS